MQALTATPTLVMLAGLPGAGKSTLAAALGRHFGWPVLDKDLLNTVLLEADLAQEQAGPLAYDLALTLAYALVVQQRQSIILDTAGRQPVILARVTAIAHAARAVESDSLYRPSRNAPGALTRTPRRASAMDCGSNDIRARDRLVCSPSTRHIHRRIRSAGEGSDGDSRFFYPTIGFSAYLDKLRFASSVGPQAVSKGCGPIPYSDKP